MYEPQMTLQGRVVASPRITQVTGDAHVVSMRVAVKPRRYDRSTGEWRDTDAFYVTLRCWRQLADNVCQSFKVGQPLVAVGRLNVRPFEQDGRQRLSIEFWANAVGHDLNFGRTTFDSRKKSVDQDQAMQRAADDTVDWAYDDAPPPPRQPAEQAEDQPGDGTGQSQEVTAGGGDSGPAAGDQETPETGRRSWDGSDLDWMTTAGRPDGGDAEGESRDDRMDRAAA